MAAHHNMLHLQMLHRIAHHRSGVDVERVDHIGDVAVHKYFARCHAHHFFGTHTAVGAADIKIIRCLRGRERVEKMRVGLQFLLCPQAVVFENILLGFMRHIIVLSEVWLLYYRNAYFSPNKRSGQARVLHKLNFYASHADANAACHKPYTKSVDKLVYK